MTPYLWKMDPKKQFLRGFTNFFRTAVVQHKLLKLTKFPNIFHWKSAKESKVGMVFGARFGPN